MKTMKGLLAFVVIGLIVCINNVKAVVITPEDYLNLRMLFSEGRVATMTDEEKEYYLENYDFENIITAQKYYKVVETTNGTTTTEVSELEATLGAFQINNHLGNLPAATYHNTLYKHLEISASHLYNNAYEVYLYNEWLVTPATKSYDVIGIRTYDGTVQTDSQIGTQTYWANGSYSYINYSATGTNIVKENNGYGISMNLVDSGSYFALDTTSVVYATSPYSEVYGSYQHAITNVTLDQSQSYSISHNGYGGVFNFATEVQDYYDQMGGVNITLPYYS